MSDFATYCAISGVCYNLATQFLLKVPWQNVLKDLALTSGKKVWSNRNAFKLVLKEAQMAQETYNHFKDTIFRLDQYQRDLDISICSLHTAKMFLDDFAKVLAIYDPRNISEWVGNLSGDALRQQLQYYITYMHSIMSNIHLELSFIMMQLQTIQMENDSARRGRLIANLKKSCRARYDVGIPQHSSIENLNDDQWFDADEDDGNTG